MRQKSMAEISPAMKIFYCYAHEDKTLRDKMEKHLGALKRLGQIINWYDREIQTGTEWEREIDAQILLKFCFNLIREPRPLATLIIQHDVSPSVLFQSHPRTATPCDTLIKDGAVLGYR
jgi:hypothetical protein